MQRLRLGTRGSKLALWQADYVAWELRQVVPDIDIEIKIIKTKGDKILDVALSKIGDKGLFTREIENELLAGEIDLAVHSMKDLPTFIAPGLVLGGVLKRENPQDVLISHKGYSLTSLPRNGSVGTSSLRRIAQLRALRPDIRMVDLRGNVETRIKKMEEQDLDGIILAYAGVKRLGFTGKISEMIATDIMLPAVGQGAIAIELREEDNETLKVISPINNLHTKLETMAERALLRELEGGCQVPIASLAQIKGNILYIEGLVASMNGQRVIKESLTGDLNKAEEIGRSLAQSLLNRGADSILAEIRELGEK
ncbi:MAG: hydroxymethylbilane synthase [Firmicutes bacterium HGW-Firmicutes-15]|nr:MAG: hydroxymethylbilane synthase [Firmicutes bacterium HGW-Firmicutes-15]